MEEKGSGRLSGRREGFQVKRDSKDMSATSCFDGLREPLRHQICIRQSLEDITQMHMVVSGAKRGREKGDRAREGGMRCWMEDGWHASPRKTSQPNLSLDLPSASSSGGHGKARAHVAEESRESASERALLLEREME